MKLDQIQTIAKLHGINSAKQSKTELIKSIQNKQGNFDCYATAYDGECDQEDCIWREDCFDAAQRGWLI